jgi:hypothetical protein
MCAGELTAIALDDLSDAPRVWEPCAASTLRAPALGCEPGILRAPEAPVTMV